MSDEPRQEFDLRYPFRWQPDGGPCWCMSKDEPHDAWLHSPLCNEMFRRWWAAERAARPTADERIVMLQERMPCIAGGRHTFDAEATVCLCGALGVGIAIDLPHVVLYFPVERDETAP